MRRKLDPNRKRPKCAVRPCFDRAVRTGLCRRHYDRQRKRILQGLPADLKSLEQDFRRAVEIERAHYRRITLIEGAPE